MIIKCTYANGDHTFTRTNITLPEAQAYYLGETFNIGNVEDNIQVCVHVELFE